MSVIVPAVSYQDAHLLYRLCRLYVLDINYLPPQEHKRSTTCTNHMHVGRCTRFKTSVLRVPACIPRSSPSTLLNRVRKALRSIFRGCSNSSSAEPQTCIALIRCLIVPSGRPLSTDARLDRTLVLSANCTCAPATSGRRGSKPASARLNLQPWETAARHIARVHISLQR